MIKESPFRNGKRAKAIRYLKSIDISLLVMACSQIQEYMIDEPIGNNKIIAYAHHLPLKDNSKSPLHESNWRLHDTDIQKIKRLLKTINDYRTAIFRVYRKDYLHRKKNCFLREVLPPWIVFPLYSSSTIGWRMGEGEIYTGIWMSYLQSLNDEQRIIYDETYPMPTYMRRELI